MDGINALSDPRAAAGEHRDELARDGLQLEANDEHLWRKTINRGNPGLKPGVCRVFVGNLSPQRYSQAISLAMKIIGKTNHSPQNSTQKPLKIQLLPPVTA